MSRETLSVGMGEASLAFAKRQQTGLRRRGVATMIVLTIATFGLYYPIWFLRRRAALNQLDSPRKLAAWPFALALAIAVLRLAVALAVGTPPPGEPSPIVALVTLAQFAVGILVIVQCFFIKDILEDHVAPPIGGGGLGHVSDGSAKLSGLMTFFFSIFYLQYIINTRVLASDRYVTTA